jgi:DnaJ-class molecular chaperone
MSAYKTLGIPEGSTVEVAKAAYRKLAMKNHPDHGGNAETFKTIKLAWEDIEAGRVKAAPPPFTGSTSFGDIPKRRPAPKSAYQHTPGNRRPRDEMPRIYTRTIGTKPQHFCDIYITEEQAFDGCFVPILNGKEQIDFIIRPGCGQGSISETIRGSNVIGAMVSSLTVQFNIYIVHEAEADEVRKDMELNVSISALALLVGATFGVSDAKGVRVEVTVPPGYDPAQKLRVANRGYGPDGGRGDLLLFLKPVWTNPTSFTPVERQLAVNLYTMINQK